MPERGLPASLEPLEMRQVLGKVVGVSREGLGAIWDMREFAGLGTKGNRLLLWKLVLIILDKVLRLGAVELSAVSQGVWGGEILPEEQ